MRNFRTLQCDEIECRIQTITENGLSLLLYKTARTDAKLLDETFGADGWQNKYEVIGGSMYCGIGIKFGDEWIWKWNCGTESNTEAEKGLASDAFKRAGFTWGLGAELYSSPFIWIDNTKCEIKPNKNGKLTCNERFYVKDISYNDDGLITRLVISNKKGQSVYAFGTVIAQAKPISTPKEEPKDTQDITIPPTENGYWYCKDCGNVINGAKTASGSRMTPKDLVIMGMNEFKKPLCSNCYKKCYELKNANK